MADIGHSVVDSHQPGKMYPANIVLSGHTEMQMQRRRVTLEDVALALQLGEHVEGQEKGTHEACIELDGRPLTVVYDSIEHRFRDLFYVVTVLRRGCLE